MATYRVHKTANYTVMSNHHLRDKSISMKAKGLLSVMLSLPEEWDYSIAGLAAISKEGTKAIRNMLQELEEARYITRTRKNGVGGRFDYDYDIYEHPQPNETEPYTPKGHAVEGHAVEGTQISTEETNTEERNKEKELDKIDKLDKRLSPDFRDLREEDKYISPMDHCGKPNAFTKELIKGGYIDEDDLYLAEYNKEFAMLQAEFGYEAIRSCLWYFLKQHKFRNGIDDNGEEVQNKLAYFRNAMRNNAEGLRARNGVADGFVGGWLAE